MARQLPQATPEQRHRTMFIIWFALIMGVVTFGVVMVGILGKDEAPGDGLPLLTYVGLGATAVMLLLRTFVPDLVGRNMFNQAMERIKTENIQDEDEVLASYDQIFMSRLIVGLALLEGAAMLNLVAYMTESQVLSLVAVGILLLVMIASVPTKSKLEAWIRNQMENYNLENQN